ncbi:MAG: hypothetical protein JST30_06185, partial [Armatimonadetes bacterium]|nr:hypothetical protein [Armatimonadota bacterium]
MNVFSRLLTAAMAAVAACGAMAQTVDGVRDANYVQGAVQNSQTQFGDSNLGQIDYANGSEADNVWYVKSGGYLYLFVGGNLESNFNKLEIFIQAGPNGHNRLLGTYPDVDFGALNRMSDDGSGYGLTFDPTFAPTHWYGITCGGDPFGLYANYSEVKSTLDGGIGYYLGTTGAGVGTLSGGNNPNGVEATVNNSNVAGVPGGNGPDPGNGEPVTTGAEIKIPLAELGNPTGDIKVCVIVNGAGHDFLSNQILPGIGGGDNLGEPLFVNLAQYPGEQWFTVPGGATTETLAPVNGAVSIGKSSSGGFGDTAVVDGASWRVCKFVVTSATSPIVRVRFDYTTTKTAPTAISWDVTAKMVHSGTFKVQLLLSHDPNNP